MKKIIFPFLVFSLLAACAAPPSETPLPTATIEIKPTTTLVQEEEEPPQQFTAQALPTPLPSEIDAPLIDAPSIINIEMMDEVYGWAVTEQNIIRTNDGGVTWYNVTPPDLTEAGYSVFTEFLDVDHAWIQVLDPNNYPNGGTLHFTSDGGLSWTSVETPFSAGDIEFVDADNGWMLADLGVGAGSMAVSIFHTSDGGQTWSRVYTNDPNLENAGDSLPLGGIKVLLTPRDERIAWVGGVIYAPGVVYLFRTDDGGLTWSEVDLPLPEEAANAELAVERLQFISETQGVLVLHMTSKTPRTLVYLTEDGGDTWQTLSDSFPRIGQFAAPSPEEIIFYSQNQFQVTNDAGQTFEAVLPDVKFGGSISDMSFANLLTGWVITTGAAGNRTLYKTTDGGQTWFQIIP
jgi:photosystem II stability/assembly factor-like uncharacterized protein